MFQKLVARYQYIDMEKELVVGIGCSVLTTSGDYVIEVATVKGMKLLPSERYTFSDRNEANAKFLEIKKRYNFKRVF